MRDQPKFTSSPPKNPIVPDEVQQQPFRETFLHLVTDPEALAALRVMGDLAYQGVLEFCQYWPDGNGSTLQQEFRAIAADLRYLSQRLTFASREREIFILEGQDQARSEIAEQLAGEVERLSREVDEAASKA